ncbi:beta-mannosidase [Paenibacillus rhizovicinus]|uniref:Beta-mannosidase n=1 Tax=Paenibacillus rhizovicinus TaxID=2704463 RepID=A0A6C0P7H3_9BACL|nr:glycosyl hydrolase [Paenibacillus rhizovicinus]QHW34504.1 beta-mannosidase [Paenibacillus rhizovicinus]
MAYDWGHRFRVEPKLIDPQADDCAKRLMAYLCDTYGKRMLTGQQIGVNSTPEMEVILRETGTYPAVGGFDFMNDSPSRTERGAVGTDTALALKWWEAGGIVTFCWHWNAPKDLVDLPPDNGWHRGFYTSATTFDLAKAMADPSSEDYALLLRDIDVISGLLSQLRDAGVPVLWRPLHEASGSWFWWGAKGAEPCIQLWKLMHDRMTRLHGLHNLIWVWNGQAKDWYPGDEFVDIIGEDIYSPEQNYQSNVERFRQALSYTEAAKIIALSENGPLADPDRMIADGALWSWNCTWYGQFLHKQEDGQIVVSDQYTEREMLNNVYRHPFTVTRDELPDLRTYPLPE